MSVALSNRQAEITKKSLGKTGVESPKHLRRGSTRSSVLETTSIFTVRYCRTRQMLRFVTLVMPPGRPGSLKTAAIVVDGTIESSAFLIERFIFCYSS